MAAHKQASVKKRTTSTVSTLGDVEVRKVFLKHNTKEYKIATGS